MEKDIENDKELYSYFVQRNQTLCEENFDYLTVNPEIKKLLNDYLANLLLHKPDDVFKFTKDYFSILSEKPEIEKLLLIVGPTGVGKTEMINRLISNFPDNFVIPRKITTQAGINNQRVISVSKEQFTDVKKFSFSFCKVRNY
jgi:guanylate kinase